MTLFKKILKVVGYVLAGLILLFIIISFIIEPIAKNFIEKQVTKVDNGQYYAQINDVDISILKGDIILRDIILITDSIIAKENQSPFIEMQAGEVSVNGFSWLKYLLTDTVLMNRVSFLDIDIEAKVRTLNAEGAESSGPFRWEDLNIYPIIEQYVDRVRLQDLRFRNIDLDLVNIESSDTLQFDAEEFNVLSDNILIDANKVFTDARAFYSSKIDILGKNVNVKRSGNPQWNLNLEIIEFEAREADVGMLIENADFLSGRDVGQDTIFYASLHEFMIIDLGMMRVQEDSVAQIQRVLLNDFSVINNLEGNEEKGNSREKMPAFNLTTFSLGEQLPELLDKVIIAEVDLQNIVYQQPFIEVSGLDFFAGKVEIDKRPAFGENNFMHARQFEVYIDSVSYFENEMKFQVDLGEFEMAFENGTGSLGIGFLIAQHTEKTAGKLFAKANINEFNISGINTRELIEKNLTVDSISVDYPELYAELAMSGNGQKKNTEEFSPDLYPVISSMLNEVRVNTIAVIKADIELGGIKENYNNIHLPELYLQISDLLISKGTAFSQGRIMHADDIALRIENVVYTFPDEVYNLQLDLFRLSTREKFLQANGLSYTYNDNYQKLMEGPETNQVFGITNKKFLIENLEYEPLMKQEGFFASSVTFDGLKINVIKNNNFPSEQGKQKTFATPQQMIRSVNLPFYVGTFSIKNSGVFYEEMAEEGTRPGRFSITEVNLNISEISNVENIINNSLETSIRLNSLLMAEGYLETEVLIPMYNEQLPVTFKGELDTLDLTKLNNYTEYTSLFGFDSGTIHTLLWDFETDNEQAKGTFGMSYQDLNIRLSESESPEPAGTLYQVGAYLANALLLDEGIAEDMSDPPRIVEFTREKEEGESFTEHYVASLMTGLLELMGFPLSIIDP